MPRELFENAARDFVAALGRLVRIGGGAERNGFAWLDPPQFAAQQFRSVLLDVDFLLELGAVAHFHEFVGVAGIAVFAGKFAAAVRIDGPGERQVAVAYAAVQQGFRREREVFNVVAFAQGFAFRGEPRDADQRGFLRKCEQGQAGHIRLLFAYNKLPGGCCQEGKEIRGSVFLENLANARKRLVSTVMMISRL